MQPSTAITRTLRGLSCSALALAALLASNSAQAATLYWDGTATGGTGWETAANWSTAVGATTPDPAAIPGSLDVAAFSINTITSTPQTVNLNADQSAAGLSFLSTNTSTTALLGGGTARTLTLGSSGLTIASGAGAVTLGDGTASNNVLINLAGGIAQTWANNSANAFTISDTAAAFTRSGGATLTFSTGVFSMSTTVLPNDVTTGIAMTAAGSGYTGTPTYTFGSGNATPGTVTLSSVNLASPSSIGGSGDITIGAVVSGGNSLTKVGAGTLNLTGVNTYSGATAVNGGKLLVNSPGSLASGSAVTVANNATFGGSGTINGTVTVNAGGTILLGASGATLTFANSTAPSYGANCTLKILASASTLDMISASASSGNSVANVDLVIDTTSLSGGVSTTIYSATGVNLTTFHSVSVIGNIGYTASLDYSTSGQIKLELTPPGPKLAITAVNGGANPAVVAAYSVTVQAQDGGGTPQNVSADTGVTLSLASGTAGSLGGTLTGIITNGTSDVTFPGVTNQVVENVTLMASTTSGPSLAPGAKSYTIVPATAATLTVTGFPNPAAAGHAGSVIVTVRDAYNNIATNYTGTVHLTSSDTAATLPGSHTFNAGNAGVYTFSGVTLNTAGAQSISATDNTLTGTQSGIAVVIAVPFTTPGTTTWTVPAGVTSVQLLVVGGGGAAGRGGAAGGGGAGGLKYYGTEAGAIASSYTVVPGTAYTVTVGAGGAYGGYNNGGNSSFDLVVATGGGAGGNNWAYGTLPGAAGGSGGGGGINGWGVEPGGAATPPGQGYAGGASTVVSAQLGAAGGGGGGAGALGSDSSFETGGNGGAGLAYSISGSSVTYAGGGGGAAFASAPYPVTLVQGQGGAGYLNAGGGGMAAYPSGVNAGTSGQNGIVIVSYTAASSTLDHFAIATISSPQTAGTAFAVATITAQDAANNTLASFTGTVDLSETGDGAGGTVTPALSGNFINGVLTGQSVSLSKAGTGVTLTATTTGGSETGTSAPFTVQSQFAAWIGGFSGVPSGQTGFNDDPNHDGIANGLAWILLGGVPMGDSNSSLPVASSSSGKLTLDFTCLKPGELGTATLEVQFSNDLGVGDSWHSAAVPGTSTTVGTVVFTITEYDATHNHVIAEIPQDASAGGKLFGRLAAAP